MAIYVVAVSAVVYFNLNVELTIGFAWFSIGVLVLGSVIVSIYCFLRKGWLFKILGSIVVINLFFIARQFTEAMV